MEDLGLCHLLCILFDAMRRIEFRSLLSSLALVTVMLVTAGCTGDSLEASKQLALSTPNTQQEEQDTSSYTSKVSNALGSYYDNTVTFLTDDCSVGAYGVSGTMSECRPWRLVPLEARLSVSPHQKRCKSPYAGPLRAGSCQPSRTAGH